MDIFNQGMMTEKASIPNFPVSRTVLRGLRGDELRATRHPLPSDLPDPGDLARRGRRQAGVQ